MYKEYGASWVNIVKHLPNHTASDIKNKFYTTLKKIATQAQIEDPIRYSGDLKRCKKDLVQFVDIALKYTHLIPSKKGRKKNIDKINARVHGLLFPKTPPQLKVSSIMNFVPPSYPIWPQSLCFIHPPVQSFLLPYYQVEPRCDKEVQQPAVDNPMYYAM